jgi:hypothetical protein
MRREAPVDSVVERTGQDRREVVRMLRELEGQRAGRLIVGRRKQKTRFVWSDRFDVLATIKKALLLSNVQTASPPPSESAPATSLTDSSLLRHRFVLRPSIEVELLLPSDLTVREAERLSDFLKTLPFGSPE